MSFSPTIELLEKEKNYSQKLHPRLSVNAPNAADAPEALDSERVGVPITRIPPDLIEEEIKENLQPLTSLISKLIQLLNQLIQGKLEKIFSTASLCNRRKQSGHSPGGEVGSSRTLSGVAIRSAVFPADNHQFLEAKVKMKK